MEHWYQLFTDESLNQIYTDYTIVCNAVVLPLLGVVSRWVYKRFNAKGVGDVEKPSGEKENPTG